MTQLLVYEVLRLPTLLWFLLLFRARWFRSGRIPQLGPVLIVSNHQSHLDPPLIGLAAAPRHLDFVARVGLFAFQPFGWLIRTLGAVPIEQGNGDVGAMKEVLRRLGMGRAVLIFPEGSRSHDGAMEPFERGVALLVKRAQCPVMPVAIEGCFDAWPRRRLLPRPLGARVAVMCGSPIPHDELLADGPQAALDRLARDIDALRLELRAVMRAQSGGVYPARGTGDIPRAPARS